MPFRCFRSFCNHGFVLYFAPLCLIQTMARLIPIIFTMVCVLWIISVLQLIQLFLTLSLRTANPLSVAVILKSRYMQSLGHILHYKDWWVSLSINHWAYSHNSLSYALNKFIVPDLHVTILFGKCYKVFSFVGYMTCWTVSNMHLTFWLSEVGIAVTKAVLAASLWSLFSSFVLQNFAMSPSSRHL